MGIEKKQAKEKISISYEVIKGETNVAVFKAIAFFNSKPSVLIEIFGSALKGG